MNTNNPIRGQIKVHVAFIATLIVADERREAINAHNQFVDRVLGLSFMGNGLTDEDREEATRQAYEAWKLLVCPDCGGVHA